MTTQENIEQLRHRVAECCALAGFATATGNYALAEQELRRAIISLTHLQVLNDPDASRARTLAIADETPTNEI